MEARDTGDPGPTAVETYDWWADAYDDCNAENDYEGWVGQILLPQLEQYGLRKGWALDIGCGTGLAFNPLLERGWRIIGCDASAGMLAAAEAKFGSAVGLLKIDVRALPAISPLEGGPAGHAFDLVLMLNDVVNYLLDDGDLNCAFTGIKANLAPDGGLAILDANTLALFTRDYRKGVTEKLGSTGWLWRGLTDARGEDEVWEGELQDPSGRSEIHRQRHWSRRQITEAMTFAGLRCISVLGQRETPGDILLSSSPSEELDQKFLYFVTNL